MHRKSTKRAKAPAGMKATPGDKRTARPKGGAIERGFKDTGITGRMPGADAKRREKRLEGRRM
jgi:hypothetical protein